MNSSKHACRPRYPIVRPAFINRARCVPGAVLLFLVIAHPLPAPIQEIQESPTAAPQKSVKPKTKSRDATTKDSESSTKREPASPSPKKQPAPNRTPFAGTWKGMMDGRTVMLTVSPAQDSAVVKGLPIWGDRGGQTTVNGNTLSWKFLAEKWSMVLAPDGRTAVVTDHGWPSGVSSGTFEKLP
ncbi:MAG: hypothetical protein QOD64_1483 [Verrucomicrobiota bacterium]